MSTAFAPAPTPESDGDFAAEPLSLLLGAPEALPESGARHQRFEYCSRGDRVSGRFVLPDSGSSPCPLVWLLGKLGNSGEANWCEYAADWSESGFAVAAIDLPLHGERASAKFSERLLAAISAGSEVDANGRSLRTEFTRQALHDLTRGIDALTTISAIDRARIGVVGIEHGALLAALLGARDPRIGATVLVALPHAYPPGFDVEAAVQQIAPRARLDLAGPTPGGEAIRFLAEELA